MPEREKKEAKPKEFGWLLTDEQIPIYEHNLGEYKKENPEFLTVPFDKEKLEKV